MDTSTPSAAARAIYDAYLRDLGEIDHVRADRLALAEAFRALAERIHGADAIRADIFDIADELADI